MGIKKKLGFYFNKSKLSKQVTNQLLIPEIWLYAIVMHKETQWVEALDLTKELRNSSKHGDCKMSDFNGNDKPRNIYFVILLHYTPNMVKLSLFKLYVAFTV